ncbi:MAG: hypothetical protein GY845_03270 [Planctomycetes bacterium]|nr:hypothetical protein [Planctomycetota bacterium]
MKLPSIEKIQQAALEFTYAETALKHLFPEAFDKPIAPGQIYSWDDDQHGMVILDPSDSINYFAFVSFNGTIHLSGLALDTTKTRLEKLLNELNFKYSLNSYIGHLTGPHHISSWTLKETK